MTKPTFSQQLGDVRQLGYLVPDIETAVNAWMQHQGIGPWTIIKNIPLACTYKGKASQPTIDIALGYQGNMQIELIQQTNNEPSPYLYYFENKLFGLHHTAYLCEHIDQSIEAAISQGQQVVCDIRMPDGGRYVYTQIDSLGEHVFIEYLAATDRMKAMLSEGIKAAANWDGSPCNNTIDLAALAKHPA